MSNWKVVIPETTTNLVTNPSFETDTTGWTVVTNPGGLTVGRVTTGGFRGYCAYQAAMDANAANVVDLRDTFAGLAGTHTFTIYAKRSDSGAITATQLRARVIDTTYGDAIQVFDSYTAIGDGWYRCTIALVAPTGAGVRFMGGTSLTIKIDAAQLEALTYETTYCDGDEPGCTWTGAKHNSTSTRSAQYRGGGRVRDFYDDYTLGVSAWQGWGTPEVKVAALEYATLPGGLVQQVKPGARQWQLVFDAPAPLMSTIHTKRDYLVEAFKPDRVAPAQPVRLRYTGATTTLEIDAWYVGGLEGSIEGDEGVVELPTVRLLSEDPYFYSLANGSASLTAQTSFTAGYMIGRFSGVWDNLDNPGMLVGAGGTRAINAIARGPDGQLYIGGDFTDLLVATSDHIAVFTPATSTWASLGTGLNNVVRALWVSPAGLLYAGGDFTSAGGVAGADYCATWDGTTWAQVGGASAFNNYADGFAQGHDGKVYIGGAFTNVGDANGDRIVAWDGSAFTSLGVGLGAVATAVAVEPGTGHIYVGGWFTTLGDATAGYNRVAKWNGLAWSTLSTGMNNNVHDLKFGLDGMLYVVGEFTTAGGTTASRIARWNGSIWQTLSSGVAGIAAEIGFDDDGMLYTGGTFTSAGGLTLADYVASWNGSTWAHLEIDLPGTPTVNTVAAHEGDIYLGFTTTGTAYVAAQTTVTNNGSRTAYPRFKIKRTGGTTARLEYLKNETTGDVIWLNYPLASGETITVDFDYKRDPTKPSTKTSGHKRITSDFAGNIIGQALLPGGDFTSLGLQPGANTISLYVYQAGAPTLVTWLEWREAYWSPDGAM